jgi:hypothetical protein
MNAGGAMYEFEYLKHEKRVKGFVQEQLQIEVPLQPIRQAEDKKEDDHGEKRGAVIIDIWK